MMTHKDAEHYAGKHGTTEPPEPRIAETIQARASAGRLPCESAFRIVEELGSTPAEVGRAADLLEVKISKCQLGLFGHVEGKRLTVKPAQSVSVELADALQERLVNDKLPCAAAWEIAQRFGMPKMGVTAACEKLGLRIKPCQLGSF
ncbi:MAG: hypothetical protein JRG73_09845 [Deltaproteobacteria bacterium]|nr:hypothetical protein [Deltaproteobacteria bacterium]MBW2307225.1 hypothetical protein [Deltaproteobacteria bacterium]